MKISESKIRKLIIAELDLLYLDKLYEEYLLEQFTIPVHNKHSDFELYTEDDEVDEMSGGKKKRKNSKERSAGFLIGKPFPDGGVKFIGLLAHKKVRNKKGGHYDIPKGKLRDGESRLEGAIRECEEECGIKISKNNIVGKPIVNDNLCIFPAVILDQNPIISPNPETGIVEHEGFSWLSKKEIESLCLGYLKDSVSKLTDVIMISIDKS